MLADAVWCKIETFNHEDYQDCVCYIGIRDTMPTQEQRMGQLAAFDTSLYRPQSGTRSDTNTNTTKKTSGRKLDLKKCAQLARPKNMVSAAITVARWVISPAMAQTAV
jgi:hypothetical protein